MAYVESLLHNCASFSHVRQIHAHLLATGLFQFYPCRAKFLDHCATVFSSGLRHAVAAFPFIRLPGTNDWNAIIRGYAQSDSPNEAVTWYVSMSRAPCKPDALTCSFLLKACARSLSRIEALQVHAHVRRYGFYADVLLQTTLLDAYAKFADLDDACKLFDEMSRRDIPSWNALIAGLAQGDRPSDALVLFNRMREGNADENSPNEVTVLGALSACSQLGAIKEGDRVVEYIVENNLHHNLIVCNAVIDMFAKSGQIDKAYSMFNSMKCGRNIVTWNTMIMGFAIDGDGVNALRLFRLISTAEGRGLKPDGVTYLAALCACNHSGMVDEGLDIFETMEKNGVFRNMKHYGTIVDLLGRAGKLEAAYRIILSMPTFPDAVLWQTLLGASKLHSNVEMAEEASRKLVESNSTTCGDYVLLSNLYASQGRWSDVGRVRTAMNKRIKKVPGFSYVEMNGTVHRFFNGDQSHPMCREIYEKLEEIRVRIREFGYEAETKYVLHDLGEEEKENALSHHSEKLAVAFGLISRNGGEVINVNKNLRICGDCHAVIMLVSKLYEAEIVVRDRTRFHRFRDGGCSCGDYW